MDCLVKELSTNEMHDLHKTKIVKNVWLNTKEDLVYKLTRKCSIGKMFRVVVMDGDGNGNEPLVCRVGRGRTYNNVAIIYNQTKRSFIGCFN